MLKVDLSARVTALSAALIPKSFYQRVYNGYPSYIAVADLEGMT